MDRSVGLDDAHRDVGDPGIECHQRQARRRGASALRRKQARVMRLCAVCDVLTSRNGSRCTEHVRQSNRSRHNALYSTRTWQRLSARVLRAWRGEHGSWCPGYQRTAHRAADLTVDHVVPLAAGGAPFDVGNTAVLCRSCNSTKGASTDRGGVAHVATHFRADRASRLCARGRVSRVFGGLRQWVGT
jgi:5-methylcytosine-specific restriction protein A